MRAAMIRPIRPSCTMSRMARWLTAFRRWWLVAITTPAASQASTMRLALATLSASGFSHSTCLPASAAATVCTQWRSGVVLM